MKKASKQCDFLKVDNQINKIKDCFRNTKTRRFITLLILILISLFLRFYNYENRWVLNQDDARDVVIGRFIIDNKILPPLGPTSSAGPFSFGPIYYWITAILVFIFGSIINGPWIGYTLLSVISVVLIFLTAEKIKDTKYATISTLLAVFSTGEISYSSTITNPVLSAFFSFLSVFLAVLILKKENKLLRLALGISIGISISSHFQSVGLLVLLLVLFVLDNNLLFKRLINVGISAFGFILTFLPIVLFDFKNNFIWTKSIYNYAVIGQNKFYLPVRWLTEITVFWPEKFGDILVGIPKFGYLLVSVFIFILISFFVLGNIKVKFLNKSIFAVVITFLFQVIFIRYYKGPRDNIYLLFVHPFVILITGWFIYLLFCLKKYLGVLLILFIIIFSYLGSSMILKGTSQAGKITKIADIITAGGYNSVNLYSFGNSRMLALPLYYILDKKGMIVDQSNDLLIACDNFYQTVDKCEIFVQNYINILETVVDHQGYRVFKINNLSQENINKMDLRVMNGKNIYNEIYLNYPYLIK